MFRMPSHHPAPCRGTAPDTARSGDRAGEPARRTPLQPGRCVAVRVTDDEHDRYQALADRKGMSLPELVRLALDGELLNESIQQAAVVTRARSL